MFVFSIAIINENVQKGKGDKWTKKGDDKSFVVATSIGNNGNSENEYTLGKLMFQLVYSAFMNILIIICTMFLRVYQKQIDQKNITASKFCLMVS